MFPDDINEMLVSDKYDEENINGVSCENDEEDMNSYIRRVRLS